MGCATAMITLLALLGLAHASPEAEVRDLTGEIVVDGTLDESVWQFPAAIQEFQRFMPSAGGAPSGKTEVRFLQSDDTLYIGVRITDADYPIRARLSPRENINADDQVGIYLDPFGDGQSGYIFYFNPLGIQQDIQVNAGDFNVAWNTVYRSRGHVTDTGYELEIALPFRSIKYPAGEGDQTWGIMVTRKVPSEGAKYAYPKMERGFPQLFLQAAPLKGVRPPRVGSGIELVPALTARGEGVSAGAGEPMQWAPDGPWYETVRPSLDIRAGLTPNLALVGTLLPDFSQVESDITPVVLNARFAFSFPERRPFFTEGGGFFDDTANTLYSRSIVAPLYGLKLAGKEGKWSIGMLHALDTAPTSSFHERSAPGFSETEVANRWASSTMVRLRHDLPRAGFVGVTLTDKRLVAQDFGLNNRGLDSQGGPARPTGHHDAATIDTRINLPKNWQLSAAHQQSLTGSRHDRLVGLGESLTLQRRSGNGLGVRLTGNYASDGLRQELGFRNQSGFGEGTARVDWTFATTGIVSTVRPRLEASWFEELNGDTYRFGEASLELVLDGVHDLDIGARVDDRIEGVDGARVRGWEAFLEYEGQIGAAVELSPEVRVARGMDFATFEPATTSLAQLELVLRPIKQLRLDVLSRYTLFQPERGDTLDDLLIRGRLQVQLTRELGLRIISEANRVGLPELGVPESDPRLTSSVLLTWLLDPFTAVYVGYAELDTFGTTPAALNRSVFAKAQVMLRPDNWRRTSKRTRDRSVGVPR